MDDLALAKACLAGDSDAIATLDALLTTEVRRAVLPIDPGLIDDVAQQLREKLLVDKKLADFTAQGPLGAWLRATAVRLALNALRPGNREVPYADLPDQPLADPDPELALLRARHRTQFKAAFEAAMHTLSSRERTLLRLTTLDGLSLASVGQMYGKDASTVSRWLAAARETLLASTRAALATALRLGPSELDSVMRAADSELNLSLVRLLKESSQDNSPGRVDGT